MLRVDPESTNSKIFNTDRSVQGYKAAGVLETDSSDRLLQMRFFRKVLIIRPTLGSPLAKPVEVQEDPFHPTNYSKMYFLFNALYMFGILEKENIPSMYENYYLKKFPFIGLQHGRTNFVIALIFPPMPKDSQKLKDVRVDYNPESQYTFGGYCTCPSGGIYPVSLPIKASTVLEENLGEYGS
jgi:hypothetical protein